MKFLSLFLVIVLVVGMILVVGVGGVFGEMEEATKDKQIEQWVNEIGKNVQLAYERYWKEADIEKRAKLMTKLIESEEIDNKQFSEIIREIMKEGNKDSSLQKVDIPKDKVEYKDGQLIITGEGGGKHIIPLTNIPDSVKEISFQDVTADSEKGKKDAGYVFTGVVYTDFNGDQAFLSKGYIEPSLNGHWVVKGIYLNEEGTEKYDHSLTLNFGPSENVKIEYGKIPDSRGGTEEGFHMWGKGVEISLNGYHFSPSRGLDGKKDVEGVYGSFNLREEGVYALRGTMRKGKIYGGTDGLMTDFAISIENTDNGVVIFKESLNTYTPLHDDESIIYSLRFDKGSDVYYLQEVKISTPHAIVQARGAADLNVIPGEDTGIRIESSQNDEVDYSSDSENLNKPCKVTTYVSKSNDVEVERDATATQTTSDGVERVVQFVDDVDDGTSVEVEGLPPAPDIPGSSTCTGPNCGSCTGDSCGSYQGRFGGRSLGILGRGRLVGAFRGM